MASRFSFGARRGAEASSHDVYETTRRNGVPATQGVGGVLRERREAMGATLAEAEVATRIRQKYLAALESDEWQLLPGEVVGRGFLRNYATYLGLEPTEIIERRRAIADPSLAYLLADTSAGSELPGVRQVDYRPKDVDLRDEPDVMETRELRLGPIVAVLAVLSLAALLWFGRDTVGGVAVGLADAVQSGIAGVTTGPAPLTATVASSVEGGVVNPQNVGEATSGEAAAAADDQIAQAAGNGATTGDSSAAAAAAADTQNAASAGSGDSAAAPDQASGGTSALAALIPTPTPDPQENPAVDNTGEETADNAAEAAAEAPSPTPQPTATPLPPEPTEEPTEEPTPEPVVVAPSCPDTRSVIVSPGVGQVVSGTVGVTGTATHEAFGYYKLEFAPGANAAGGFVYFAGAQSPVSGGLLGNLNTAALGNGDYTILLTVVDATGNFPPPCQVTISVQN